MFTRCTRGVNLKVRSCIAYEDAPLHPGFACVGPGGLGPNSRPVPGPISSGAVSAGAIPAWAGPTRVFPARLVPRFLAPAARATDNRSTAESRGKRSDSNAQLLTTTAGILRRVAPNQLVIEPDDHRVVWYRLAPQMTVRKDGKDADLKDFALGDYLSVDSNSDDDSIMTAVSVTWKKAGTPDDIAEASKTWDLPRPETVARGTATSSPKSNSNSSASSPPREAGDERPVLRRKDPEPAPAPPAEPKAEPVPDKPKEVAAAAPPKEEEPDNTSSADPNASARSEAGRGRSRPAGSEARRAGSETADRSRTRWSRPRPRPLPPRNLRQQPRLQPARACTGCACWRRNPSRSATIPSSPKLARRPSRTPKRCPTIWSSR